MNTACPECGEPFDRIHEADWLITWINAYTATTLVLIAVLVPLNLFTGMSLLGQVGLSGAVSAVFLAFSYPRIKGMSIGILHMMRSRWQE